MYGLTLKLELTGSADACPPNCAMRIFHQVMSTTSTLNMYISILAMC